MKQFHYLQTVVSQWLKEQSATQSSKNPSYIEEIENYLKVTSNSDIELVQFCIEAEGSHPNLALITVDVLVTPASTAPVECVFSSGGDSTRGKRNRLTDHNLEREVLLKKNKYYVHLSDVTTN